LLVALEFIKRRANKAQNHILAYHSPRVRISWFDGPRDGDYASDEDDDPTLVVDPRRGDSASHARAAVSTSQLGLEVDEAGGNKSWESASQLEMLNWMRNRKWRKNCKHKVFYASEHVF
jgi:hypothetical protein